jgi:hypothetical protein
MKRWAVTTFDFYRSKTDDYGLKYHSDVLRSLLYSIYCIFAAYENSFQAFLQYEIWSLNKYYMVWTGAFL